MALRQGFRQQSWDSVQSSDASHDIQASVEEDSYNKQAQPRIRTIQDVHNALHPLRATADRVGKEVEKFAESLDRLALNKTKFSDCRQVLPIVRDYEKIATETVARLRRYHEPERQERLKGRWRRKVEQTRTPTPSIRGRNSGAESGTTVEDLENWEQERQTWQLLRLILQSQYPAPGDTRALPEQEAKYQKPISKDTINRYSSEHEIWTSFLSDNSDVWEKHVVVEWLKSNAESNGPSIDVVIDELDEAANRGRGLSAHGWLYSKEAIKNQKRLRGLPQPQEPSSSLDVGLMNKNKTKTLVTQLDPDAFSRQGRSIEVEDIFFERAAWLGCWEMLRRGESWQAIRSFCQERVEGWRALAIHGDPRSPEAHKNGLVTQQGPQSRILWRKTCETLARDGGIDDYENAVYGFLSGNLEAVQKVARGWDDHLFALYNSQILQQFDHHIQRFFPERLPRGLNDQPKAAPKPMPNVPTPQETWQLLLQHDKTKVESRTAIKMIQGSLIAHDFKNYVHEQGLAIGRSLARTGRHAEKAFQDASQQPIKLGAAADINVEDYDVLRIITHTILIFMELGLFGGTNVALEQIVFAYVSFLANAGKYELLPIYASKLTEEASIELMAGQLHLIPNASDQKTIMSLMQQYGLNTAEILRRHLEILCERNASAHEDNAFAKLSILEAAAPGSFDMPVVISGFLGAEVSPAQAELIHAVEWYMSLDGAWEETLKAGTLVYKKFLREGAFSAAATLAESLTFTYISEAKSRSILGFKADLALDWISRGNPEEDHKVEIMLRQSDTFRGLENMMYALISLDKWKSIDEQFRLNDPEIKAELQAAHNQMLIDMEPLLNEWLDCPESDEEKAELDAIRNSYLPEIILAYISAIYGNGHKLSREYLPKIMNLAIDIAAHGSKLGECFQASGRMAQLVDVMSVASLAILRAEEAMAKKKGGKVKKTKLGRRGENLDIWNTKAPGR